MIKTLITALIDIVPLVGNIRDNIASEDGGKGKLHYVKLIKSVVRLIIALGVIYLIATGKAEVDDLKIIKGF